MTTVVTGASGHVGANLVRSLIAQGRTVRALVHQHTRALEGLAIETVQGDICNPESLRQAFDGADVVYHLAASISIMSEGYQSLEAINVTGTRNVVEACLRHRVKRLIHFSSIHAVAPPQQRKVVDESCPTIASPVCSSYDESKAQGEAEIGKGVERGLNAVIIRPTAIIGPNDYQLSHFGAVLLALANGSLPGLVAGGFDWVDVRDVVQGAMQAEATAPTGSVYFLSGHWASLREVALLVEGYTSTKAPRFTCPLWLAAIGAPIATAMANWRHQRLLFTPYAIAALRAMSKTTIIDLG